MADSRNGAINGRRVALRAVCRADLDQLRDFVNDPEVMRFSNVYRPIDDLRQERWFEGISQAAHAFWFAVDEIGQDSSHLIGTCCLVDLDTVARSAELRIRLGHRASWNKGLGTEAASLLLRFGFDDLNLERIWLRAFYTNERAIALYQKLGFQQEGRLRRAAFIKGSYQDVVIMGLLRDEWRQSHQEQTGP
jgi:RimJ/RimL family protein N-acetyltransferase